MLPQPGVPELLGVGVQCVLRKAVLGARLPEALLPRGIVAGQRSGVLIGFGLAHQAHASARLPQAGVVDLAGRFQPGEQHPFLGTTYPQQRRRGPTSGVEPLRADRRVGVRIRAGEVDHALAPSVAKLVGPPLSIAPAGGTSKRGSKPQPLSRSRATAT